MACSEIEIRTQVLHYGVPLWPARRLKPEKTRRVRSRGFSSNDCQVEVTARKSDVVFTGKTKGPWMGSAWEQTYKVSHSAEEVLRYGYRVNIQGSRKSLVVTGRRP
jgi:hypothetical protein